MPRSFAGPPLSPTSPGLSLGPRIAPSRALMLASLVGCLALFVILFAVLLGCTTFGTNLDGIANKVPAVPTNTNTGAPGDAINAISCHCECDGIHVPPKPNPIAFPQDDAFQQGVAGATATVDSQTLTLGQGNLVGLRFFLGVPPNVTIASAYIQFMASNSDTQPTSLNIK